MLYATWLIEIMLQCIISLRERLWYARTMTRTVRTVFTLPAICQEIICSLCYHLTTVPRIHLAASCKLCTFKIRHYCSYINSVLLARQIIIYGLLSLQVSSSSLSAVNSWVSSSARLRRLLPSSRAVATLIAFITRRIILLSNSRK